MWPFDKRITVGLNQPYQRGFLLATLGEIKEKDDIIIDILANRFPEILKSLIDALGVSLLRAQGANINSLFQSPARTSDGVKERIVMDDGTIVEVE